MNPAPLPQPSAQTCPNCGIIVENGATFCHHCGATLAASPNMLAGCSFILAQVVLGCLALIIPALGACFIIASEIGSGEELGIGTKLFVGAFTLLLTGVCIWGIISNIKNRR